MSADWSSLPSVQRLVLEALAAAPDHTLSNSDLRSAAKLSEREFNRARVVLLERGLVTRRQGRGWPLVLIEDAEVDSDFDDLETRERMLYRGLTEAIPDWERFTNYATARAFDVSSLGRRKTGGRWSRTDLLAIGIKDFRDLSHVPNFALSVHAIEVKTWHTISVDAVFEVLMHRDDVTHTWVFTEVPAGKPTEGKLERVKVQAARYGVGLVAFTSQHDAKTWVTLVEAERRSPRMFDLNSYLKERTTPDVHAFLSTTLQEWQGAKPSDQVSDSPPSPSTAG